MSCFVLSILIDMSILSFASDMRAGLEIKYPLATGEYSAKRERFVDSVRSVNQKLTGHFHRAYKGKSYRAAITAKCLDCCCFQTVEVGLCPVVACPLWEYRPYQG